MFEMTITAAQEDTDQLGHVNNITYLRWVQEIAIAHWNALAPAEDIEKLLWVVLRHEIDYKAQAFAGDVLTVRTWVGAAGRLKFERNTEILRGGKLLAKALTVWCPIDRATGRPTAPGEIVRALFSNANG